MKKENRILRVLAGALAIACVLTLGACSGGANESSTSETSSVSSAAEESSAAAEESSASVEESSASSSEASSDAEGAADSEVEGLYASVEEYVNTEEFQAQMEEQLASMEQSGLNIEVTGEGNKLIYTYTFDESIDTTGVSDQLSSSLQEQASIFEMVANSLTMIVDVEDPVVEVTYKDSEGNVLASEEFSAAE